MYPWLETAISLIGTKETPGTQSNPTIVEWAKAIGGFTSKYYTKDEIPWCGLFVAYCLDENELIVPKNPLSALEYLKWGQKLKEPNPGAIMIFGRDGGGHVGFYVSEDKDSYHILGGNQSDMVCMSKLAKNRLKGIRWPSEFDLPNEGPVQAEFAGKLSLNEA